METSLKKNEKAVFSKTKKIYNSIFNLAQLSRTADVRRVLVEPTV